MNSAPIDLDLTRTPLNTRIQRMALAFVSVFAIACVAVAVYEVMWAIPARQCAERNGW